MDPGEDRGDSGDSGKEQRVRRRDSNRELRALRGETLQKAKEIEQKAQSSMPPKYNEPEAK